MNRAKYILIGLVYVAMGIASPERGPSAEQIREILQHNRKVSSGHTSSTSNAFDSLSVERPYAEYEKAKYFFINANTSFDSGTAKIELVRSVPREVKVIVLTESENEKASASAFFKDYSNQENFEVVNLSTQVGLWARDSLPIPVYVTGGNTRLGLVDAKYYHANEPDSLLANFLGVPVFKHDYYYEGGNFAADDQGNCMAVDKRISNIPDTLFQSYYGCKKLMRLPFDSGIGHVDEHAKFIGTGRVVTDVPSYVTFFESNGYQVYLAPRPEKYYETYVNSLIVNGTLFLPQYGENSDAEAAKFYESLGFKLIGLPSSELSNSGKGSIHCITMTYPDVN